MSRRSVFSDDQVREIVRQHRAGAKLSFLVQQFGHRSTVQKIINGKSHRDVLCTRASRCHCPACVIERRREANLRSARGAKAFVWCLPCGAPAVRSAVQVEGNRGGAACVKCRGAKT